MKPTTSLPSDRIPKPRLICVPTRDINGTQLALAFAFARLKPIR